MGRRYHCGMKPISYARHRFPPALIRHAVWLYMRFTLSYRDVEDLLAERGLDVSYETVRRWVLKFGPGIAANLRKRRHKPDDRWHLDEMVVLINGRHMYLWRAVDSEGEVLDMLVQPRRNKSGSPEAPAETAEATRVCAARDRDRQAEILCGRVAGPRLCRSARPEPQGEQSGGELTSADPTARTQDAGALSHQARPSASFPFMLRSTTPSTSSATCSAVPP